MLDPRKRTIVRASECGIGAEERGRIAEIAANRIDGKAGIVMQKRLPAGVEDAGVDVDRKEIERRLSGENGLDQMPRLPRAAAPQLDQAYALSERRGDLHPSRPKDLILGTGNVVLRQLADGREERRAERVVEVMREQKLRHRRETAANIIRKAVRRRRGGTMEDEALAPQSRRRDSEGLFHLSADHSSWRTVYPAARNAAVACSSAASRTRT